MDEELEQAATAVAAGRIGAFRTVVERTSARLYRRAARLLGSTAEAEDALQDSYVRAYEALRDGRFGGQARVETWLHRIVVNACLDALRRRKVRPELRAELPEGRFDGELAAQARLALRELDRWLAELPPAERVVMVLRCVEGLTSPEVAELLECSEGAVEQRLVRARAALRQRGQQDHE